MSFSAGSLVRKRASPPPRSASSLARPLFGAASMQSTSTRRPVRSLGLALDQRHDSAGVADLGVRDDHDVAGAVGGVARLTQRLLQRNAKLGAAAVLVLEQEVAGLAEPCGRRHERAVARTSGWWSGTGRD